MREENSPSTPGLYRFVGVRKYSVRNDTVPVDEVLLVEEYKHRGTTSFVAVYFGRAKVYAVSDFTGTWYYIGDEIERITTITSGE